jgi:hypothetical protein
MPLMPLLWPYVTTIKPLALQLQNTAQGAKKTPAKKAGVEIGNNLFSRIQSV